MRPPRPVSARSPAGALLLTDEISERHVDGVGQTEQRVQQGRGVALFDAVVVPVVQARAQCDGLLSETGLDTGCPD